MYGRILGVLLVLLIVGGVAAQDDVNCGTLRDADCQLLAESQAVMAELDSAAIRAELILGTPGEFSSLTLRLVADGAYVLDREMIAETDDTIALIANAIRSLNSDINVIVEIPDLGFENVEPIYTFDLRLVDGIGYANFDKIITSSETATIEPGWYGFDVIEAAEQLLLLDDLGLPETMAPVETTTTSVPLIETLERTNTLDSEDGQSLAVFGGTQSFDGLIANPVLRAEVEETFYETMVQQFGLGFYTEKELRDTARVYTDLMEYMTISTTRTVGTVDQYLHELTFSLRFDPTFAAIDPLYDTVDPYSLALLGSSGLEMDFSISYHQFNEAPLAIVPEDATIIPYGDLFGGVFGSQV